LILPVILQVKTKARDGSDYGVQTMGSERVVRVLDQQLELRSAAQRSGCELTMGQSFGPIH